MQSKRQQQGFVKLFFMFGSLAFVVVVVLKLFPLYSNNFKLVRVVNDVAAEGSIDPAAVRFSLGRRWDIEDITNVLPKDIGVERGANGGGALTYDYEARTHLFYNVDLVLKFKGRAVVKGG